ncbi:MAG TPA: hypothetical protein VFS24_06380 [Steroidobacteraceae bacterium]|nr:hypothetical protein [Steroidobacteraceae bacterium]
MAIDELPLGQAWARVVYTAQCKHCGYRNRVDLKLALERLGPDVLLRHLRPKLRCSKCGSKDMIVAMLDKQWTFDFVRRVMEEFPLPYD